jgi:hypothetical protein
MTSMADAKLLKREILLDEPKRFVREVLVMGDGFQLDWFYVDTPECPDRSCNRSGPAGHGEPVPAQPQEACSRVPRRSS